MLTSLLKKYPDASVRSSRPGTLDLGKAWFTNEEEDTFIGIDRNKITEEEVELLKCLFIEVGSPITILNGSFEAREWFSFLYEGGHQPQIAQDEYRIIQFSMNGEIEHSMMKEAFQHLLPEDVQSVLFSDGTGLFIERKSNEVLDHEQLFTISHVIESDFFVSTLFFTGQFHKLGPHLPEAFSFERKLFSMPGSLSHSTIHSVESLLPSFLLHCLPSEWKTHLLGHVITILEEDPDWTQIIKVFLENQANVSQTAKQLFMHRNSVQYRIERFIDKTGIDIRSFQGAILAYLACLDHLHDKVNKEEE